MSPRPTSYSLEVSRKTVGVNALKEKQCHTYVQGRAGGFGPIRKKFVMGLPHLSKELADPPCGWCFPESTSQVSLHVV